MAKPWELPTATTTTKKPWELANEGTLSWDESPIDVKPTKVRRFIKGEPVDTIDNRQEVELASKGIILDSPGDGALSLQDYQDISYYSAGPEYARNYVGKKVKEKYPQAAKFSPSEVTRVVDGKIQYLDFAGEKPRWRAVNDSVLYSFGKPAMWGEVATDIPATFAATMAGGLLGPATAAVGGGTASGLNSYLWRKQALKKGRELGINEGLDDSDLETLAISTGLMSAGMSFGGAAIAGWPRSSMQNSLFDRKTAGNVLDDYDRNLAKTGSTVDEINAIGKGLGLDEQFDPTPAQRSGIREIKDIEATHESGHAAKATQEIATDIRNRKNKDKRVLQQIWEGLFPKSFRSTADVEDIGLGIRASAYEAANNSPEALLLRRADSATGAVKKELATIDDVLDYDEALKVIRGEPSPNGKLAGTKFYDLRDRVVATQQRLTEETAQRGANVTVEISDRNLLLPRLIQLRQRLGQGLPSLSASLGDTRIASQLDELIQLVSKGDGKVPFNLVDKIHQDFGALVAKVQSSPGAGIDAPNTAYLSDIAATLEEAITTYSKTGPVYARDAVETWVARKEATKIRHDIFDRKAVRQALASEELDGPTGKQIFGEMFTPESPRYLRSLVDLVKGDEESMNQLRQIALYRYKQAVTDRHGNVDLAKHNAFVSRYRQHLDMLFPDGQPKPWAKVGTLQQEVVKATERAKVLDKAHSGAWYQIFGPKYKYSSYNLVNRLAHGNLETSQADYLIKHLEKTDPALLGLIREEALGAIRLDLSATKLPTAERLAKFARSRQGRNFARLMGADGETYLKNINLLSEAISMVSNEGKSLGQPAATLLTSTTRAAFGPLHRIQRFITAGRQVYQWMNAKDAYEIISDPVRLQRALQYAALAPSIKSVPAAIAADIGALGALFVKPEDE